MGTLDAGRLGSALAEAQDRALAARERAPIAERLERIHAVRAKREAASASLRRPLAVGALLGAVASVALLWPRATPLRFDVGEPSVPGLVGVWVAAPPGTATPIGFSDGTRIVVGAGARARVAEVTERGARIVVERGSVRADVVPRRGNDWRVIGGPFEIHVTGTSFDASWDPEREQLTIAMHHGRVVVRGPCLPTERTLADGDRADISCAATLATVTSEVPPPPARATSTASSVAPATPTVVPVVTPLPEAARPRGPVEAALPPAEASSVPSAPPAPKWRELARANHYKEALASAEADGFPGLCDELGAADLMELGAAARLSGRVARAKEAYVAVRRRFAGSDAAATAAFHLGQLAFDGAHAYAEAHRWFVAYLAERPAGGLAAEALGRLMEAEQRLGDLAAARATATKYLARYPKGAHSALATSVLTAQDPTP